MLPTSAKSQLCTTKTLCPTAAQRYVPYAPPALSADLDSPGKVLGMSLMAALRPGMVWGLYFAK